jgi:apolipoprotein N-acyltransferase
MTYYDSSSNVPQPVQNNSNSIISLIAGILGLTLLPAIGSIVAIITGLMARKEIREARENGVSMGGDGMAVAGLVMGWLGVGLGVCVCCVIAVALIFPAILAAILVPLGIYWGNSSLVLPFPVI